MTSGRQCSDQRGVHLLGVWCISHVIHTMVYNCAYWISLIWCMVYICAYWISLVWCISSRRGIDADQAGTEVSIHGDLCNLTQSFLAIVKWECDQCGHKLSADINLNNHETNVQRRELIHVSKGLVSEILFDAGTLEHHWSGLAPCENFLPLWKFSVKMHQKLYCTKELLYVENICGLLRWRWSNCQFV